MKKLLFLPIVIFSLLISCTDDASEDNFIPPTEEAPIDENNEDNDDDDNGDNETPTACNITTKDGLLILEGESFELQGKWGVVADEKASGGKYIEYTGANNYNSPNLTHEISVKFYVPAKAGYRVKWFMRQPPEEASGDLANDVWIYFPGDLGRAYVNQQPVTLEHYEKFVSRSAKDGEFAFGGALDLHNPKSSSWMTVDFPEAGEYTLNICARSKHFQLDKIILSTGLDNDVVAETSKDLTETSTCD
ncbi:hypothetical protein FHR24_000672 [Wenyingzhuangia heitensis]|uniref:Uncharacterized protein n=1 Tax=Wenyingzhuangia heitensis TaxID=1487859 RepID=A0ABX0U5W0_9FLAO|nr:hypothetical protein [Wenyingzhuangia heitensis]NIJ44233.1 hypothetical protein [Wenyingzhuangia heitensis]